MEKIRSAWDREQDGISEKLKHLVQNTGYRIRQSNGQRIFEPIDISLMPPPQKGAEIFIGNLPHDLFEDELIPLFCRVGPIYNLRLMLDFFGRNRGFVFISYYNSQHAHLAVLNFNGFRIRKKTRMAVAISVDNRRLFVGNIPRDRSHEEIEQVLRTYVEGIVRVILYQEPYDNVINRGFVFVEFVSHREAAIARRQLSPGNLVLWGKNIYVDWAEPLPVVNPKVLEQVTKLYLNNIPTEVRSSQLRNILGNFLPNSGEIVKVYKMSNFAFIHFSLRKHAQYAYEKLQHLTIMGNKIGVEWARPIEYSKRFRRQRHPENYCRSVPPCIRRQISPQRNKSDGSQVSHPSHPIHEVSSATTGSFLTEDTQNSVQYCENWISEQLCKEFGDLNFF